MYTYDFDAVFYCGLNGTNSIVAAIQNALIEFNGLVRENYKNLAVTINTDGSLHYRLISGIPIGSENILRCTQFFSKNLSKEPIMQQFIRPNRLMKRK